MVWSDTIILPYAFMDNPSIFTHASYDTDFLNINNYTDNVNNVNNNYTDNIVDDDNIININESFRNACQSGNDKIIEKLMLRYECPTDDGFELACEFGHIYAAKLIYNQAFISADTINHSMAAACKKSHIHIIKWLMTLGANDYNLCLYVACHSNQLSTIRLMLQLGANNIDECIINAIEEENIPLVELLSEYCY